MEFLVTMTTHVPEGTAQTAVEDVRAREAAHSRELAAQGHLLRLWRPPLLPGEWRSLGLFDAAGPAELEEVLLSMPLRVWRSDEPQPLSPHPNDPGGTAFLHGPSSARGAGSEFLTAFSMTVPPGTPSGPVDAATARDAVRAHELAGKGQLLRLWTLTGNGHLLGLWREQDSGDMEAILASLPLSTSVSVETTQLSPHPTDPGLADD